MLVPCKLQTTFSAIPCVLRQFPKAITNVWSAPFRYAENKPKMWTFIYLFIYLLIRTLFSYNIVVSCACAATHKNRKLRKAIVSVFYNICQSNFANLLILRCCSPCLGQGGYKIGRWNASRHGESCVMRLRHGTSATKFELFSKQKNLDEIFGSDKTFHRARLGSRSFVQFYILLFMSFIFYTIWLKGFVRTMLRKFLR